MDIEEAVEILEECAQYEGSEGGEFWISLAHLWRYRYMFEDSPLEKALEKEIMSTAKYIKDNCKFVEEEVTQTRHVKRLEWIGD